jgi:hypothetical protein
MEALSLLFPDCLNRLDWRFGHADDSPDDRRSTGRRQTCSVQKVTCLQHAVGARSGYGDGEAAKDAARQHPVRR